MNNIEDRLEIQDLVNRYAYFCDSFMIQEWADVFAPDGTLDESAFGKGKYVGHDEIIAYGQGITERVQHIVHLMSNLIIWEVQGDTARGTSFAIVESMLKTGDRARYQVKYEDEYQRINGRWVINTRVLRTSFPPEMIA